ncbi:GlmU family protein [Flavobacteriaceae bacterium]|nr:GlmU family protein [Flavobacteriaceae bacterium]RZO97432.1 MAG: glucose-1-phosphate thymidylyltransferase [Flavobacteriales bacterium]
MNYILFDGPSRNNLLPLTYTRPVAEIRVGILTIREKWEAFLESTITFVTEDYLSDKYPMVEFDKNIFINASFLPNNKLVNLIINLKPNELINSGDDLIAFYSEENQDDVDLDSFKKIPYVDKFLQLNSLTDIFKINSLAIEEDFTLLTKNKNSSKISKTNNLINPDNIFIEEGLKMEYSTLNASNGPIYISKNCEIMEGSLIRGPFALGENSTLKLGSKIYGGTTIGPHCKIGGEVSNSVVQGYSNKGHDGFLGNSLIGEWCNLGADTNTSNLKNNYADVKIWNYDLNSFLSTGEQFCGLIMGDHSKSGINTMFNTGTVVGVCSNVFGSGFPRNFIPSFSWGGNKGFSNYKIEKVFEVNDKVMKRRNCNFSDQDKAILTHLNNITSSYRSNF